MIKKYKTQQEKDDNIVAYYEKEVSGFDAINKIRYYFKGNNTSKKPFKK